MPLSTPLIAPIYAPLLPASRKVLRDVFAKRKPERLARNQERQIVRSPLMPCILDQPRATHQSLPLSLSLSLYLSIYLSISVSGYFSLFSLQSKQQLLRLRSVLIFGGALIYQRVWPLERPLPLPPTTLSNADTRPTTRERGTLPHARISTRE